MKIVYEEVIPKEGMDKISEKLNENSDFELKKNNIKEFFNCNEIFTNTSGWYR